MQGFTAKQTEFLDNATHRWNIKSGATRSGKTYLDYYVIPKRIRSVAGKDGLIVMLGNTKGTLQRNIIEPLQGIWGTTLVSDIKSDNTAYMFGEKVYCLGADKINQTDRIRGTSIKYCYGDEVVTWHKDVFNMLKTRLDKSYSKFDGTCNPDNPNHWFHDFLKSNADIYLQEYTIFDNNYLPKDVLENIIKENEGTIYYDRYVLGKWVRGEGRIYKKFANNPDNYLIDGLGDRELRHINIGVDFGGNKSQHAMVATGITTKGELIPLRADSIPANGVTVETLITLICNFAEDICNTYGFADGVYCDSAEQTIINSVRNSISIPVYNSVKGSINDRIRAVCLLMGSGRFHLIKGQCQSLIDGLCDAVWSDKEIKDVRLDDGTSNIDILDAFEYSFTYYLGGLINV